MANVVDSRVLPFGWVQRWSRRTGEVYYLNLYTCKKQWDIPERPANEGSSVLTPQAFYAQTPSVQCSHILVKHSESLRPFSWRRGLDTKITRTRDEALAWIKLYRSVILSGRKTFAQMAEEYSDCVTAKSKDGLVVFRRSDTGDPFEDAALALNVGELSEPVFTVAGVHLILRTA
ncbi:hypothetical protein HPB50_003666 [Hyalomma asiaticum]|uniref:Uncharacterized protein n=1 Tax=Hyalomma asiaticum TaxID=266040 RepID=A0ACB7TE51_HYAAI|nr:hypothetical protein HPB50_003666 [Hyalomma asiaticum]